MDKEKIDFSIITPSYNYEKYIRETIESVKNQENVSYEHIIYDAESTDGTVNIIREYPHIDLTIEADGGMSEAINKGFRKAKGEWVMWLNADDRLKPGALAAVKEFAQKNTDADMVYGEWDFIDANGDYIRTMRLFPFKKLMLAHYGCYIGSTSTFLKKATTVDQEHLLDESFTYVMDGEYYNRLAFLGKKIVYFPKILADFRMHEDNHSQQYIENKSDITHTLRREKHLVYPRVIRRFYGWTFFKSEFFNGVIDCVLYYWFKLWKPLFKRL